MPDRFHAFGQGNTYPVRPQVLSHWSLQVWVKYGIEWLLQRLDVARAAQAAESFCLNAEVGTDCRVGINAWCVNHGSPSRIQLGDRVICRGILRCENWRDAQLMISSDVYIGDDCLISCAERIEIGQYTLLAHGVQIFDNDSHPVDPTLRVRDYLMAIGQASGSRTRVASAPVWIGDRVWLGFNSIILKGVRIGEGSVVAAGSVVTSDVPPHSIVAGSPARIVKSLNNNDLDIRTA